jgi:microcystin-dependent protein
MKKLYTLLLLLIVGLTKGYSQYEPYLGEIRIVASNYAPKGWALCDGQLFLIAQNQALFSLLGTTYGGNGITTFALPDLRGRTAIDDGNGHTQGEKGGETTHTLTTSELPAHTHTITNFQVTKKCNSTAGDKDTTKGTYYAKNSARGNEFSTKVNAKGGDIYLGASAISNEGGSQPHSNMAPYTVVTFIIALQGIFPSQN